MARTQFGEAHRSYYTDYDEYLHSNSEIWTIPWTVYPAIFLSCIFELNWFSKIQSGIPLPFQWWNTFFYFPVTGWFCIVWDSWHPVATKTCHRYRNVHGLVTIGSYVNIATRKKKKGFVSSFLEFWQFGWSILKRRSWISIRWEKRWHFQ